MERERANKILWDTPVYLDVAIERKAIIFDIVVRDKDNESWIIVETTIFIKAEITAELYRPNIMPKTTLY